MASPYELLAGLALLREKKRNTNQQQRDLREWSGFQVQFGGLGCLIPSAHVEEVITADPITPVKGMPAWVSGLLYCRGQLVTLVDVAVLLLGSPAQTPHNKAFIIRGAQEWFGLQVGAFTGVRHIWSDTPTCAPPMHTPTPWSRHVRQWLDLDNIPTAVLDVPRLAATLEDREART